MTDSVESRGRTAEEAIAEALLKLGARREEVDVETLEEPRPGVLGLFGNRLARVRVWRKGTDGRDAPRETPISAVPEEAVRPATPPAEPAGPPPRQQPRWGGELPGQERPSGPTSEPAHLSAGALPVSAISLVPPVREVSSEGTAEVLERLTGDLLRRAGFPSRCEVKEGDYWLVKVITDETSAGMLIGRHGATIDAIEHLVERMASQATGGRVNMNLDINNYRRRREEKLVQRAQEAAQHVKRERQEAHFEPMSARERRTIHLEVAKIPGLQTFTIADGAGKHVVVAPADRPRPGEGAESPGWDQERESGAPGEGGLAGDGPEMNEEKRSRGDAAPSDDPDADI